MIFQLGYEFTWSYSAWNPFLAHPAGSMLILLSNCIMHHTVVNFSRHLNKILITLHIVSYYHALNFSHLICYCKILMFGWGYVPLKIFDFSQYLSTTGANILSWYNYKSRRSTWLGNYFEEPTCITTLIIQQDAIIWRYKILVVQLHHIIQKGVCLIG
jgi:hypothetical protein